MERVQTRDLDAWQRLVKLYGPLVHGWCQASGLQTSDAADVLQEVLRAVLTHVEDFRRDRPNASFRGWLWTITKNKISDHFRHRRKGPEPQKGTDAQRRLAEIPARPADSSLSDSSASEDHAWERRAIEFVRTAVEQRTWEAFWRVCVEGRTVAEVAQELEMTTGAVYKAKYRVLRLVRDEYREFIQ